MRIARFSIGDEVGFGVLEPNEDGARVIAALSGHPLLGEVRPTGQRAPLEDVRLLSPVLPSKVVCIGKNYAEHVAEMTDVTGGPAEAPTVFLKPSTSVVGPGEPVFYPSISSRVDFEGELAIVIARVCREVPPERVQDVIFGYTCANDITARDLQASDTQWTRAKGFDSFCPIGPWIDTDLSVKDAGDLRVTTTVDGEVRQDGRTSQFIYDIPAMVSHVTSFMTLLPGDVLLTGTPAGVGPMEVGQEVTVAVERIGELSNRITTRD